MRQIKWDHRPLTINQLVQISDQILQAGLPFLSTVPGETRSLINFRDEATDEQIEQALAIAEAYDPVAVEADAKAKRAERAADMRPFKQVHLLIDDNVRDAAQVDKATLAQLRGLVLNMLDRESILLKAVARLMEGHFIDEGDGQ